MYKGNNRYKRNDGDPNLNKKVQQIRAKQRNAKKKLKDKQKKENVKEKERQKIKEEKIITTKQSKFADLVYDEKPEREENKNRFQRRINREIKKILKIKEKILKKNGIEPTICFYYYLWNAVDYVGEERLRQSFESISGQGDEIIVGDYGSTDKTKEIALEYGFRVINVPKTEGITFHETKICNAVINKTKCNFLVDLNVNIIYPNNMTDFYKSWITKENVLEKLLVGRGVFEKANGSYIRNHAASCLFYVPFLKYLRGFDERAYYGYGATHYAYCLLVDILKLKLDNKKLGTIHLHHRNFKDKRLKRVFKLEGLNERAAESMEMVEELLDGFFKDIDTAIKNVENSYW